MGHTYKDYKMWIILGIIFSLLIVFSFRTPSKTLNTNMCKISNIGMPNNAVNELRKFLKP